MDLQNQCNSLFRAMLWYASWSSVVCVWFVGLMCYVHNSVGYGTVHCEYHYNVTAASVVP